MSQEKQPTLHRQLLLGIFVVSGFSGLLYESIWSSVAAAQIHVGDLQQAAQLLERTRTALDHSQSYSLLVRQLLAIAQAGARAPQTGS
jgi:hypothetical protein